MLKINKIKSQILDHEFQNWSIHFNRPAKVAKDPF